LTRARRCRRAGCATSACADLACASGAAGFREPRGLAEQAADAFQGHRGQTPAQGWRTQGRAEEARLLEPSGEAKILWPPEWIASEVVASMPIRNDDYVDTSAVPNEIGGEFLCPLPWHRIVLAKKRDANGFLRVNCGDCLVTEMNVTAGVGNQPEHRRVRYSVF